MGKLDNKAESSDKDTKQSILNATVDLIREGGFHCITLRSIAARAETNLALVNYYYGSKDKLFGDAVKVLMATFDDAFNVLEDHTLPPRERMKLFFTRYIMNLSRYPGMARQMLDQRNQIMGSQDEYARYSKLMRIERTLDALGEITGEQDRNKLMMMMMQINGAIVYPLLMMSSLPKERGDLLELFKLPSLEEQVDGLFELYFHKYN
ncbi:TetR/AcrR family transcriptional regulator [Paenibacillus sp. MMS20-IR301]|uniref:TetR/AcrR family transcriptional regulator n=1 Tax=Paenibacillus sp. MMS20-IR301 TaxID=2895946 RepID=UPI0028EDC1BD|nr:TetR/AcrR family transcriptional regulator [Paenibacillus sp. MMS20-IR301]WNS45478.1 TetR/AcrR family transcriptional regulator [Paenibacillus sp. MMS20-IR301]